MSEPDPVLARRARIARLVAIGQRLGYALFIAAVAVFVVGFIIDFTVALVTIVVVCLAVGSLVLAPSIVLAYAVRAAEREDEEHGHHA